MLPAALEYIKAYALLAYLVRQWCILVGGWLQLDTYLLSRKDRESSNSIVEAMANADADEAEDENYGGENRDAAAVGGAANEAHGENLADRHQALLLMREPQSEEHYERPSHFVWRLLALLVCLVITLIGLSAITLVVPGESDLSLKSRHKNV